MIRVALLVMALFLLPFLVAAGVGRLTGRTWKPDTALWPWLAAAGLLLTVAAVFWLRPGGAPPGAQYTPAKVVDGHIVPGETR